MITKKHIRKYLDQLSSDMPAGEPRLSDHVWRQLHEYLVKHYKRLDKGARAYADEIFDQLDASLKHQIESLPEGRDKKTLTYKFAMVRGERSPLPVLYLDTPVIENFIRQGLGQPPAHQAGNNKVLYEEVLGLVKGGALIYPENTFHREALQMGGLQAQHGLNIMREFSQGLSFKHNQTIEDWQVFRALLGFIQGNGSVNFRSFWKDVFEKKTVNAIMQKRSSVVFKNGLAYAERTSKTVMHGQDERGGASTRLRIRCDENALKEEQALQIRYARHLRDLVRLGMRYHSVRKGAEKRHLEGFWAGQKTDLPVALWNYLSGQPEGVEGLIAFYESEHFRDIPAIRNKQDIWNAFSENHTQGLTRVTGPPDISVVSCILPYTDMMILGPKMAGTVRDTLKLDAKFDTEIYSMNEEDRIVAALKRITFAD